MNYHIRVRATALIIQEDAVLLVEYDDKNGIHYNLPGGGAEPGESVIEAVQREVREETCAEVEVGSLALVYEYAPHQSDGRYGPAHGLSLIFSCRLRAGSTPRLPDHPDPNQTAVHWVPLDKLHSVVLYPKVADRVIAYARGDIAGVPFIEEADLHFDKPG